MVVTAFVVQSPVSDLKRSAFYFVIDREQWKTKSREPYLALGQQQLKPRSLQDIEEMVDAS